ncbi:hypothetical protein OUZ56_015288 [Daphnia magna]|uniref:Uncharacterized protein n=1 Tax=Daphnia magna TaxID=35525 RepID=A0ABR0AMI1_9CRUS|nr:hypothetical protein OUZ56_015288 [Daphnia magna]
MKEHLANIIFKMKENCFIINLLIIALERYYCSQRCGLLQPLRAVASTAFSSEFERTPNTYI